MGWGSQDREESKRAVRRALDLGVNFFDTADVYGQGISEMILGEVLPSASPDVVICTKYGIRETETGQATRDFSPAWLERCIEGSLKRLRRDRVDVLLLHSPPDDFNWSTFDRGPLEKLVKEGKIRCYGTSCRGYRGAENVLSHRFGSVIEAIYNVLDRRMENKVLPQAQLMNIGVIARVPLASGFLTGKYIKSPPHFESNDFRSTFSADEIQWRWEAARKLSFLDDLPGKMTSSALRFCLSHPGISTVIPGMRSVRQVEDNVLATALGPLPLDSRQDIERLVPQIFGGWA
jgi:aryl-alcohol dehydrogenase-like predicted oxidoreductase